MAGAARGGAGGGRAWESAAKEGGGRRESAAARVEATAAEVSGDASLRNLFFVCAIRVWV